MKEVWVVSEVEIFFNQNLMVNFITWTFWDF